MVNFSISSLGRDMANIHQALIPLVEFENKLPKKNPRMNQE